LPADLLPEAYIAPRELRDPRDLLRHRVALTRMRSSGVLQDLCSMCRRLRSPSPGARSPVAAGTGSRAWRTRGADATRRCDGSGTGGRRCLRSRARRRRARRSGARAA
jgi:hypothetical protein